MCCLKNEQETYEYLNSRLPLVGDSVITPTGMHGEVSGVNVLRQLVKVVVDNGEEKELQEYAVDDLKFTSRRRRDVRVTDEEMKELEGLEDNGSTEEENERPQRENRRENNRGKYRREQNDASPETDVGSESRENREKNDSGEKREYRDRSNYRGKKREYRDRNDNGEKREYRERSNYRGRNYNRDRGENADRENSGGGGEKREYRGERNFRRHRNYDRKNYQGGNNERGEQNGVTIHSHERLDELHRNGYWIIQDPGRFCFGMDAVLLSGFAKVKPGERALDLGTGTGIIPILLEAKTKGEHFTGLEIQPESADMAARSVAYNHLEEKITIVTGDIKEASARFGAGSFEVITTNPPYMIGQHGIQNDANAKTIARHEVLCDLDDILRESAKILKQGGRFYMVHRPFRLAEIFSKMVAYHIEPKRMRLVYPFVDKEPNMVLIEGLRGGKSRLTVEKPLIVYKEPGVYMPEIYDIYGY